MSLGVYFCNEIDNIVEVERIDITGDLLVLGRHLGDSPLFESGFL